MNRILYSGLFYLALPVLFLRLLWLSSRMPEQRQRWRERLALYPAGFMFSRAPRCVLIHAVSVGEVHAAKPLIEKILDAQQGCSVVVTTSTPTGSARVRSLFADRVFHLYLPYDLPGAIRRFLDRVNPDVLVIMETELWPNLIHYCARRQVRILLANARLSDKSFRGYARIRSLTRTILGQTDMVCAQAQTDGVRLINLGLDPQRLIVTGSIKFDQSVDQDQVDQGRRLRQQLAARRPVLIAASTRDGEERKVLKAFRMMLESCPELLLILVPRHPQRFDEVYRQCLAGGFSTRRRSSCVDNTVASAGLQILLGDSMGEMQLYYGAADIAFVGGSLVNTGCQNILEPAVLGLPILTGPSLFNFQAISEQLISAGALRVVENPPALAKAVRELLHNQALYRAMSVAAEKAVRDSRGATDSVYEQIARLLPGA